MPLKCKELIISQQNVAFVCEMYSEILYQEMRHKHYGIQIMVKCVYVQVFKYCKQVYVYRYSERPKVI